MGKTTLKNTDFLGKREKITSKAVKITVFYYLCTVMQSNAKPSKAKQCKVMQSNSSINKEYISTEYESKELNKNQVTQVGILLAEEGIQLPRLPAPVASGMFCRDAFSRHPV